MRTQELALISAAEQQNHQGHLLITTDWCEPQQPEIGLWFPSLDLKSWYWKVEMDKESKPLTAFMVGWLRFFESERMPFGLTSAPLTFQWLIEPA